MKIKQTENELIIQETPGCLWIFGLFFAFVGAIFVYGSFGGLTDYDKQAAWMLMLAFLMGAIAVACGVWIISRAPVLTVSTKRLFIRNTACRARKNFAFVLMKSNNSASSKNKDGEGDAIWSLGMDLANRETIKISSLEIHDESFKRNFVFQTNEFMRKQMLSSQIIFELEDESGEEIS